MENTAPECDFIDSHASLARFFTPGSSPERLIFDLEADGLYSYEDKICLVQLGAGGKFAILDPLKEPAVLEPFRRLLIDPGVEKIAHGADYDVRLLKKGLGIGPVNLFDTMIAAQMLGYERLGLAALLEEHFGVTLDKRHQRADWSRRPLTKDMLDYAAADVTRLEELSEILKGKLAEAGRTAWAEEEFRLLEKAEPPPSRTPWCLDVKGAIKLKPRELAVLQALLEYRDDLARKRNRPPFKVLGNQTLMIWAVTPPKTPEDVATTEGVSRHYIEKMAPAILEAVEKSLALPDDKLPQKPPPTPRQPFTPEETKRLDRLKAARATASAALKIDAGILANTATLEKLARAGDAEPTEAVRRELKNWQWEAAGETLAQALAQAE